jgi:ArsR family transcriptional regulator, arsenate/arsenite/antimonite-responsive transcriptional repressor / arsenate reductase (thioredoxin)
MDKVKVLFLCTHNQARSQMAEALLRHMGDEKYEVYSAGTDPAPQVHPMAVLAVEKLGFQVNMQKPKHMREFEGQKFDYIITVCDRAKAQCPTFPGDPVQIHWDFADPVAYEGSISEWQAVFDKTAIELANRIRLLMQLPAPHQTATVTANN